TAQSVQEGGDGPDPGDHSLLQLILSQHRRRDSVAAEDHRHRPRDRTASGQNDRGSRREVFALQKWIELRRQYGADQEGKALLWCARTALVEEPYAEQSPR